ncbi:hypothetical protein DPX16_15058 [Anabarilius grahami]|uniref:Uncharacterized protein n=1 Tax=Anabarilius grahami TaxID=495550 RepID=A0A3N0YY79_ANAGA|nr:hypothetical protein DPX16_15058 [Anabarilius grahami]
MDGLLMNCATGCRVDEAFTMDDLVDSISADTSGLRCGHVQLRIVFITPPKLNFKKAFLRGPTEAAKASGTSFSEEKVVPLRECGQGTKGNLGQSLRGERSHP